ncbi:MAG: hypothetical protein QM655_10480 [Nocardioidaceae bacterium]
MVGRHARTHGPVGQELARARFGLRELLVVTVVGGALPAAILLLLPQLRDRVDDLDAMVFVLAAAWPILLTVVLWTFGRRRPARLASPTIALFGTALACGAAYLGKIDDGYTGMARNGLVVLGTSLVAAGVVLAAQRIADQRGRRVAAAEPARVPQQRVTSAETSIPTQRSMTPSGSDA